MIQRERERKINKKAAKIMSIHLDIHIFMCVEISLLHALQKLVALENHIARRRLVCAYKR